MLLLFTCWEAGWASEEASLWASDVPGDGLDAGTGPALEDR